MCGRFDIHSAIELIARVFEIDEVLFSFEPNYNAAPTQEVPLVINDGSRNILVSGRWGFLPPWTKEKKTAYAMINARAETIDTNRSYKDAFVHQRCLVVADGFYEWLKRGAVKVPHYIGRKAKLPMAFAGLYTEWKSPGGEEVRTAAIVTTNANELVAPIHDRMPVILHEADFRQWLDPAIQDKKLLLPLLKPFPADELEMYAVSPAVNSFKINSPDNIKPIVLPQA